MGTGISPGVGSALSLVGCVVVCTTLLAGGFAHASNDDRRGGGSSRDIGLFAPGVNLGFERITVDDGLPENSVRDILQDSTGFLWFGTQNGLVRYDGVSMTVYSPSSGGESTFGGRTVLALHEDRNGLIWIGTLLRGLWVHDPRRESFEPVDLSEVADPGDDLRWITDISEDPDGSLWIATSRRLISIEISTGEPRLHDQVVAPTVDGVASQLTSLLVDSRGRIWCSTNGAGVALYQPGGDCRWFVPDDADPNSLASGIAHQVVEDPAGRIWIASAAGLSNWQDTSHDFRNYRAPEAPHAPGSGLFIRVAPAGRGMLWVGSANGLYLFDPARNRFRRFGHDRTDPRSLLNGPVLSLLVDRSGVVWAGSWHTGLNKVLPHAALFRHEEFLPPRATSGGAAVEALLEDRDGRVWVGTSDVPRGRGVGQVFERGSGQDPPRALETAAGATLPSVLALAEDRDGRIWVGTYEGLWRVEDGIVVPAMPGSSDVRDALRKSAIQDMALDAEGSLWIATHSGMFRLRPESGALAHYRHDGRDPASLGSDMLISVHVDAQGRVWTGTDANGLNLIDPADGSVGRFFDPDQGLETVADIHESASGTLWLATFSGLIRFEPSTGETEVFDRKRGLPNDEVVAILPDGSGRLWLSTGFGVCRFEPDTGTFLSFRAEDGLPDNEVRFTHCRDRNGLLYFGGARDLLSFDPSFFTVSRYQPRVVITSVAVSDSRLIPGEESPLPFAPPFVDRVDLSHAQNDLSISFAALDFGRPDRNRYRFRLEGYDENWRVPGSSRTASYTNLSPGTYRFRVLGSNRDGVFGEEAASLAVVIHPPWWSTGWAWSLYALLTILAMWALQVLSSQRSRMRTQIQIQRARAEQLQEVDDLKTRLLTNITHEFRTPLTLIKAQVTRLRRSDAKEDAARIDVVVRNADRLEQLIDQLLDLSRLEAGRLPLSFAPRNSMAFLRVLVSSFESLATQHGIALESQIPDDDQLVWMDVDALEKIVGNLLSNAVKYTPHGGRITVGARLAPEVANIRVPGRDKDGERTETPRELPGRVLQVSVTNTGAYLGPEVREMVFERFYRASSIGGSGVGLALVKELTEWLGGSVRVDSSPEQGTCFTAQVPAFLTSPDGREGGPIPRPPVLPAALRTVSEDAGAASLPAEGLDSEPRVLVVEDHAEIREFICNDLGADYRVLEAENGEIGMELAVEQIPDLVISDVMMPGIDGFELCRRLKEDPRTSHVPVILLTALSEMESKHQGLREGADDYLAKPFDADELKLRAANLIEQRRRLALRYQSMAPGSFPQGEAPTSEADRFVRQVEEVIEIHLDDVEFRIGALCREVGVSRSQLHRKLKAVTGRATSEFVRTYRLGRAAQLLEADYGNITEVAYAVGFQNLSYFARCFRDVYGVQPSEYLRGSRERASANEGGDVT